jgi:hypothetical protein
MPWDLVASVVKPERLAMIRYSYLILLPLAPGLASLGLASATRCTTSEAQTLSRWHTGCVDADLHQADAPADRRWEGRCQLREEDPWNPICTRAMHASP